MIAASRLMLAQQTPDPAETGAGTEWGLFVGLAIVALVVGLGVWWAARAAPGRMSALGSVVAAVLGALLLVIPFIGVYAAVLLDPAAIALGARAYRSAQTPTHRRLGLAGLLLGLLALAGLIVFLGTGAYSEFAR